jgi:hypothetical protein
MTGKIKYEFSAKAWQHSLPNGWFFVSLPVSMAKEIRQNLKWQEEGWGRLKAEAKIGNTKWQTAVWFDTKHNTYLLPLKAGVRKKENVVTDKTIKTTIWI